LDKARSGSDQPSDSDDPALISSRKSYEMCVAAAGHITSISRLNLRLCTIKLTKCDSNILSQRVSA